MTLAERIQAPDPSIQRALKCSACHKPRDRKGQRYCRACQAAYQREWRKGHVYVPRETAGKVIVCAGPPMCHLEGNAAIANAKAGCAWCKRIVLHRDGTETETGPGLA